MADNKKKKLYKIIINIYIFFYFFDVTKLNIQSKLVDYNDKIKPIKLDL